MLAKKRIIKVNRASFGGIATLIYLTACSAQQVATTSPIDRATSGDVQLVLAEEITIKAKRAKESILRAGTKWSQIGSIDQGDVYASDDQVVILNSFDVFEASIVIADEMVVGYFLNVENTFVEAKPVKISLFRE